MADIKGGLEGLGPLGGLAGLFGGGGSQEFPFQELADRLNSFLTKGIKRGGLPGFAGLSPEQQKIIDQFLSTTFPAGLEALSGIAQQDALGRAETLMQPARQRALEQTQRATRERLNLGNNLFSTGGQFTEAEATGNVEAQFLNQLASMLPALTGLQLQAIGALPGFTGQGISIGDIPRQVANQKRLEPIQLASGMFQGQGLQGIETGGGGGGPLDAILQLLGVIGPIIGGFMTTAAPAAAVASGSKFKHSIKNVNDDESLKRVMDTPVREWSYKGQSIRHMGPMAEDFRNKFGLGDSEDTVYPLDIIGTVMSATKALSKKVERLEASQKKRAA